MKVNKKMFESIIDVKVKTGYSEPACMLCLPPSSLKDHKSLYGVQIHERIDCPDNVLYAINEERIIEYLEQKESFNESDAVVRKV